VEVLSGVVRSACSLDSSYVDSCRPPILLHFPSANSVLRTVDFVQQRPTSGPMRRTTLRSPFISLPRFVHCWPIVPCPRRLVSLDRCRAHPIVESVARVHRVDSCSPCSRTAPFPSGGSRRPRSKLGAVDHHRFPYMSLFTAPPVLVPNTYTATLQHVVLVRPSAVVWHSVDSTVFDGEKIRDSDTHFVR